MSSSTISTDGITFDHEKRMSQVLHTHNIFYAKSIDAAKNYILSKIATSSEGFDLQIPSAFYFTWRFQEFLDLAQERNQILRYRYFPDDCRLQIVPMGSPVHSSFCLALSYSLLHNIKADFFPERLQKRLNIGPIQTSMDDFDDDQPAQRPAQKKAPAVSKNPDSAIIYRNLRGGQSITVIVEVGFSESYQDLLSDAEQWLLKGNEDVNLVILVDIKEDRAILNKTTSALDSRTRLKKLVAAFGNDEAKRRHNSDGDNDNSSDVSDPTVTKLSPKDWRSAVESQLNIDDWVGPLSAFLEFWELKNVKCEIRGQRFPILPRPKKPVRPAIPIIDMIPISERAKFKEVDTSREMDLDMNEIRVHVRDGRQRLAFARAKEYLRPRPQDNDPTHARVLAVSSILSFDIYGTYINPRATDAQLIRCSYIGVVSFSLVGLSLAIGLREGGVDLNGLFYVLRRAGHETAVAYTVFKEAGFEIQFATEAGNTPKCDERMISGISGKLLGAKQDVIKKYNQMIQDPAVISPLSWSDPNFSVAGYDMIYLPGGHDKAVRQTIDSEVLQKHLATYFPQTRKPSRKVVAAVCHGVQTLSAATLPDGKSVLHDATTTALQGTMESSIFWITRPFLGDYYKTYGKGTDNVETIVRKVLDSPDKQFKNSLSPAPFIVEDEVYNYVSGRFPPDTETLAKRAVELVKEVSA